MEEILLHKKIAEFRKAKQLSMSELASRVEMTPSMLSQIERGTANPSINTLKLIAQALEIPIYRFFMADEDHDRFIQRSKDHKRIIFPENNGFVYVMMTPEVPSTLECIMMEIHPGAASSDEPMGHSGEEVAVVLEGKVLFQLDTREFILHKGDSVKIEPGLVHRWSNPYDKNTRILFAVTPPVF